MPSTALLALQTSVRSRANHLRARSLRRRRLPYERASGNKLQVGRLMAHRTLRRRRAPNDLVVRQPPSVCALRAAAAFGVCTRARVRVCVCVCADGAVIDVSADSRAAQMRSPQRAPRERDYLTCARDDFEDHKTCEAALQHKKYDRKSISRHVRSLAGAAAAIADGRLFDARERRRQRWPA